MPELWMDVDVNLAEVPVNLFPLIDSTDFVSREVSITYDQAGMDLVWNFVTPAGAFTQTAVVPTTGGNYDWTNQGDGMYTIEIIATGGASINNDTEGFGWFTGVCTGVLPWRGPVIGFRRAALNDLFIEGGTASTNLEDFFDGTGYVGGTAKLTVDATAISGDTTAADNAEAMFDGAGYAGGTIKLGVNLIQILGTTLTETAGQIAAAFKKFFDKATPTGTINSIPDAVAGAAGGLFIAGTNAATAVTTALTANITGNLSGSVGSVTGLTAATVHSDLDDIQTRLPAALVSGKMNSDATSISGDATAADTLELFAEALDQVTGQIDNGTLGTSLDTYQCKVELIDDDGSGNDRYSVVFFKNGEPITSGITVPKITVIKDADGTTLIAEDDLTEVGALGHYRYTEGTDRVVSGAAYKAKITATIASATRSWFQPVGRDSTV